MRLCSSFHMGILKTDLRKYGMPRLLTPPTTIEWWVIASIEDYGRKESNEKRKRRRAKGPHNKATHIATPLVSITGWVNFMPKED